MSIGNDVSLEFTDRSIRDAIVLRWDIVAKERLRLRVNVLSRHGDDRSWIWFEAQTSTKAEFHRPRALMNDLAGVLATTPNDHIGRFDVTPVRVATDELDQFFSDALQNRRREVPAFVTGGELWRNEQQMRVENLAEQFLGVLTFWTLSPEAFRAFNRRVPESHRIEECGARCFPPGVDLWSPGGVHHSLNLTKLAMGSNPLRSTAREIDDFLLTETTHPELPRVVVHTLNGLDDAGHSTDDEVGHGEQDVPHLNAHQLTSITESAPARTAPLITEALRLLTGLPSLTQLGRERFNAIADELRSLSPSAGEASDHLSELFQRLDSSLDETESCEPSHEPYGNPDEAHHVKPAAPADYSWQDEALQAWADHDHRGIIEAITGAGKTHVGVRAAKLALEAGGAVVIVVPSRVLLEQWRRALETLLPDVTVEVRGGGSMGVLRDGQVLISTVQSLAPLLEKAPLEVIKVKRASIALIADECHRYAAAHFRQVLKETFGWRLGLTATLERPDGGHDDVLLPYFTGKVYTLGYARALRDGVIAPFQIGYVPVELTLGERVSYEAQTHDISTNMKMLKDEMENGSEYLRSAVEDPSRFEAVVSRWADEEGNHTKRGRTARRYRKTIRDRRRLLADAANKPKRLQSLLSRIRTAHGTLIFTQTQEAARRAIAVLQAQGLAAGAVFGGDGADEQEQLLGSFKEGELEVLAAPKVLDEGVDVPAADLAIVVSASRSRRQMVQRLGRVVRRKPDGGSATLLLLYASDTVEDPAAGNMTFLEEIQTAATEVFTLDDEMEREEQARDESHSAADSELSSRQMPDDETVTTAWHTGETYILHSDGTVRRERGGAILADSVGADCAQQTADLMLAVRPQGGRFRVGSTGVLVTIVGGKTVFVANVGEIAWFPRLQLRRS